MRCEVCGNEYHRVIRIRTDDDQEHVFDSFECAIHALAPTCEHCGCRIVGHGVEADERIFCCASCARHSGEEGLVDNADHSSGREQPASAGAAADGIAPTRPPADE
ncbi:MAG TPA: hypothetical protein VLA82_10915 [Actinomycetota bacterium]|nr:hypothetical protein [Actinomycetota bacterium]